MNWNAFDLASDDSQRNMYCSTALVKLGCIKVRYGRCLVLLCSGMRQHSIKFRSKFPLPISARPCSSKFRDGTTIHMLLTEDLYASKLILSDISHHFSSKISTRRIVALRNFPAAQDAHLSALPQVFTVPSLLCQFAIISAPQPLRGHS